MGLRTSVGTWRGARKALTRKEDSRSDFSLASQSAKRTVETRLTKRGRFVFRGRASGTTVEELPEPLVPAGSARQCLISGVQAALTPNPPPPRSLLPTQLACSTHSAAAGRPLPPGRFSAPSRRLLPGHHGAQRLHQAPLRRRGVAGHEASGDSDETWGRKTETKSLEVRTCLGASTSSRFPQASGSQYSRGILEKRRGGGAAARGAKNSIHHLPPINMEPDRGCCKTMFLLK